MSSAALPAARPPARLLGVLERVDERLPRGRDDVLGDADRAPDVLRRRRRRSARVIVASVPCVSSRMRTLKFDELDVGEVRVDLGDRRRAARCRAR